MLEVYRPSRRLRFARQSRLVEPRVHKKYGERAFSVGQDCGMHYHNTLKGQKL